MRVGREHGAWGKARRVDGRDGEKRDNSEVRGQKSEGESQRSEIRGQTTAGNVVIRYQLFVIRVTTYNLSPMTHNLENTI